MCGRRKYNPSFNTCYRGVLNSPGGRFCCGTKAYSPSFNTCCRGVLNFPGGRSCCRIKAYSPSFNTCCSAVLNFPGGRSCCGTKAYSHLLTHVVVEFSIFPAAVIAVEQRLMIHLSIVVAMDEFVESNSLSN